MKFKNVKVGDMVYDYALDEFGVVKEIKKGDRFPLYVKFSHVCRFYTYEGFYGFMDKQPVLFWNKITIEEDFCLIDFLRSSLVCKNFKFNDTNRYIAYDHLMKRYVVCVSDEIERDVVYFYNVSEAVILELNTRKISKEELFTALRVLKGGKS